MGRRIGPKKVRRYSVEFKVTAVKLSGMPGVQVQTVADAWTSIRSCCRGGGKKRGTGSSRAERRGAYLLGFGADNFPIFSRRQADGTFEPLEDVWRASKVAITQIGHTGGLIGPGMGNNTWLWGAFRAALEALPPIPTWPTLSS